MTWPPPDFRSRIDRVLGRPAAFALTAALLLALFSWTFVANPDRVAPTKDPAYYTWRTEMLLSEPPQRQLEIKGAFDMFSGGYRVAAPVLGGYLRTIPGVDTLKTTIILMVALPVLTALLLAGFAYRQRPDPLMWHSVALGSASLFLTPPFVGYLDNVLCLFFLAASLPFLDRARYSWPARAAFAMFVVLAGMTHPTTVVIFCATLGLMAAWRLLWRRFALKSVIADDGPILLTAFLSVVFVYLVWKFGVWGPSANIADAALPPPYGSDFFVDRLMLWVKAMRPLLNGPLFAIGLIGLIVAARRQPPANLEPEDVPASFTGKRHPLGEDELTRVSLIWLAPLVGIFGFLGGLTYPYYRFFNTTLAWVLLVGVGIAVAARYFIDKAGEGGTKRVALLGVVALLVIVGTNFTTGFKLSGWNNAEGGWISAQQREDLSALRAHLANEDDDRPVVFVIDQDDRDFQIWGFTKLSGNTSRYGLPPGMVDQAFLYLGSLENYLAGEPTLVGEETYDKLSPALLEDAEEGFERSEGEPIVVAAAAFNETGENATLFQSEGPFLGPDPGDVEVLLVSNGNVGFVGSESPRHTTAASDADGGILHLLRVIGGLLLLLLPGLLAFHYFIPDGVFADGLGMVPALSLALLITVGTLVLGVTRTPFTSLLAGICIAIATAFGYLLLRSISRHAHPPERVIYGP
ncbi:MAG TPA: hypothetical protein VNC78_12735 [Actinomycetota bacterium]|nr:hypothetical protein [Actinomycetota bacterium]